MFSENLSLELQEIKTGLVLTIEVQVLTMSMKTSLDEWLRYRSEMPTNWINGYDRECVMRSGGTYNLAAIPSLYLLDKDKTVLVKDAVSIPLIESAIR